MDSTRKILVGIAVVALVIGVAQAILTRTWPPLLAPLPVALIALAVWPRKT